MLSLLLGVLIGFVGGYFWLFNEFDRYGKQCGFRCDRCKCNYCVAKKCWTKYNHLHNVGGVNVGKDK